METSGNLETFFAILLMRFGIALQAIRGDGAYKKLAFNSNSLAIPDAGISRFRS